MMCTFQLAAALLLLPFWAASQETAQAPLRGFRDSPHNVLLQVGGQDALAVKEALGVLAAHPERQQQWKELLHQVRALLEGPAKDDIREALLELLEGSATMGTDMPSQTEEDATDTDRPVDDITLGTVDEPASQLPTVLVPEETSTSTATITTSAKSMSTTQDLAGRASGEAPSVDLTVSREEIATAQQPTLLPVTTEKIEERGECYAVGGWGALQCSHVCAAVQLECDDQATRALHQDLSLCVGAALDVYGVVTKASQAPASSLGGGCMYRATTVKLLSGEFGCQHDLPNAALPHLTRLCCCTPPTMSGNLSNH